MFMFIKLIFLIIFLDPPIDSVNRPAVPGPAKAPTGFRRDEFPERFDASAQSARSEREPD